MVRALRGFVLDHSQIQKGKEIGRGSFGVVYKGSYRKTPVAIKEVLDITPEELKNFEAEAETMRKIPPHPNVVLFRGVTLPPDPITIVTDFCEGGSLREKLTNKDLFPRDNSYNGHSTLLSECCTCTLVFMEQKSYIEIWLQGIFS